MKLYQINDCDVYCANSLIEAINIYKADVGEDGEYEDAFEIPDNEYDCKRLRDEGSAEIITFREALLSIHMPGFFCSTEY